MKKLIIILTLIISINASTKEESCRLQEDKESNGYISIYCINESKYARTHRTSLVQLTKIIKWNGKFITVNIPCDCKVK